MMAAPDATSNAPTKIASSVMRKPRKMRPMVIGRRALVWTGGGAACEDLAREGAACEGAGGRVGGGAGGRCCRCGCACGGRCGCSRTGCRGHSPCGGCCGCGLAGDAPGRGRTCVGSSLGGFVTVGGDAGGTDAPGGRSWVAPGKATRGCTFVASVSSMVGVVSGGRSSSWASGRSVRPWLAGGRCSPGGRIVAVGVF